MHSHPPIFVVDNSRRDEISRIIINYEFGAMKATFLSPWWLIWRFYWLICGVIYFHWERRKKQKSLLKNIFRPRFVFLQWRTNCCSKKQIWQIWLTCPNETTRKHRILRIPVQLLAEIGTWCFANSRDAIHTSSAIAITEIVILTSTFLNFSF